MGERAMEENREGKSEERVLLFRNVLFPLFISCFGLTQYYFFKRLYNCMHVTGYNTFSVYSPYLPWYNLIEIENEAEEKEEQRLLMG